MQRKKEGFSLVELSIVLVILGLLTGGILAGQSLIRASELRSLTSQVSQYNSAIYTFRERYTALPGDITSATTYWGRADGGGNSGQCAAPATDTGTGTQTCNGDGNQIFAGTSAVAGMSASDQREGFRIWQHLVNAGLIEGFYNGVATASVYYTVGTNVPATRISSVGMYAIYSTGLTGSGEVFAGNPGNVLEIGKFLSGSTGLTGPFLKPEEAWNIDTKLDDGKPAFGKVKSRKKSSGYTPNCATTDTESTAEYNLTSTSQLCDLLLFL